MIGHIVCPFSADLSSLVGSKDIILGVDYGAFLLAEQGIEKFIAYGDFDSVDAYKMKIIEEKASEVIRLDPVKDVTDTAGALEYLKGMCDHIVIHGGIHGSRLDHFWANMLLCYKNPNISLVDNLTYVTSYEGKNVVNSSEYKYISFFTLDEAIVTLKGFKYPLDSYLLRKDDPLCISNELLNNSGEIDVKRGRVIAIFSKNDR